jgi:hypothetical protein
MDEADKKVAVAFISAALGAGASLICQQVNEFPIVERL